jgi:anti-sigma factor RsiW
MDCEQVREQLEAYALGALEPEERDRVARHLAGCPECSRLAAQYAEIAADLPLALAAASPLRPPPELKERLVRSLGVPPAEATAPAPEQPANGAPPTPPPTAPGGVARPDSRDGRAPWRPLRESRRLRPSVLGALAAVLLLAFSLGWSARLSATLAKERALNAGFRDLVGQQEVVLEVVDSPKTVKAVLRPPQGTTSPAYGKLYTRPDLPNVVVMAAKLTPPPPGQAYHVWLTQQGRTSLAGVLTVNDQGFGLLVFDAGRNGPVYDAARLTLQPEGATAPAAPPVLVWEAPR